MPIESPTSYWIEDANLQRECPSLNTDGESDIAIIGGGFSGLWSALAIKSNFPDISVALFESNFCGSGPSGRNGGIVYDLWDKFPLLLHYLSAEDAFRLANYAEEVVQGIPSFLEENGVDAECVHKGALHIATSLFHDDKTDKKIEKLQELGKEEVAIKLSAREVATLVLSPRFRGGTLYPNVFTVQPARLAKGLREVALAHGVEVFEGSKIREVKSIKGSVRLAATNGYCWRSKKALFAGGCPNNKIGRNNVTISSSHMVITEPVPDVLEACRWIGGEAITDERNTVHYMRTTKDGRIAFGLGAGKITSYGEGYSLDQKQIDIVKRDLFSFFPNLLGKKITRAWGGPIDISPTHLPFIEEIDQGVFQVGGYTGAGVGMSAVVAKVAAGIIMETGENVSLPSRSKLLPPDPIRRWSASLVRRAMLNREDDEERGMRPRLIDRVISDMPEKVGIRIGR